MGKKGAKLTTQATDAADTLVKELAMLGDVSSRKMFGGYGIFESGVMFALVNSEGIPHLRVNDSNLAKFEKAGAEKHGRMPYYAIPPTILQNARSLRSWAVEALTVARSSK